RGPPEPSMRRESRVLSVGDDGAEDHHDVEVQDEAGRRLADDGRITRLLAACCATASEPARSATTTPTRPAPHLGDRRRIEAPPTSLVVRRVRPVSVLDRGVTLDGRSTRIDTARAGGL